MSVDLSSEPIMDTGTQHFCVEVMKLLDIERKNGQFCDLILEVGSGDEKAREPTEIYDFLPFFLHFLKPSHFVIGILV